MFIEGAKFFTDAENLWDNQPDDNENAENDNFEKEEKILIMKLNCLNIEMEEYILDKKIFEKRKQLKNMII